VFAPAKKLGIEGGFSNVQMTIYLKRNDNRVVSHIPGLHP
jgi:hypothetical protein